MPSEPPQIDGTKAQDKEPPVPKLLERFLVSGASVERLAGCSETFLVRGVELDGRLQAILHARIGSVSRPSRTSHSSVWCIVATIDGGSDVRTVVFSANAIRQHFYLGLSHDTRESLYEVLAVEKDASFAQLRLAWRIKSLAAQLTGTPYIRRRAERAFNLLANPGVRFAYDRSLFHGDEELPFPYESSGVCVLAGRFSEDGKSFFSDSILAFKPTIQPRRFELLLRQCEFLPDRITFKDSRRKVELWLDAGLLEGLAWDSTWNYWKPWLRSRISIASDFVESPKIHFEDSERVVTPWWIALPSRISITMPASLSEDIEHARAFHDLLGRHAEILTKVRKQAAREPVEAGTVQFWFDELGAAPALRPEFATWQPDYDEFYFDQLRQRSRVWFLFREEYLFVLPGAVVSEIPMAGHASYIFAEPPELDRFLRRYSEVVRTDIRMNKNGVATELGFVGRVLRGTKKKRWLADVLKHSTTGKENEHGSSTDE